MPVPQLSAALHGHDDAVARRLRAWRQHDPCERLLDGDTRLWSVHDTSELGDRLGWLDLPLRSPEELESMVQFACEVHAEGFHHTVLLGMGGSSLAAELFAGSLAVPGEGTLEILDSTHPHSVQAAVERLDPRKTFFLAASKSGTTLETESLYRFFRQWLEDADRPAGPQFAAITDPGSELARVAEAYDFRRTWLANPEVGGRYSALSEFGLVPAALCGGDLGALVASARTAREMLQGSVEERGELLHLAAILGELAVAGVDKLTLLAGRQLAGFPAWVEQLVAESLGKRGRGIVPVTAEPVASARAYDPDRLFICLQIAGESNPAIRETLDDLESIHPVVRVELPQLADLGFELFRWEVAVALAATVLGVHPFNQPDVEEAKRLARRAITGELPEFEPRDGQWRLDLSSDSEAVDFEAGGVGAWLRGAVRGGYVAVQAYLRPSRGLDEAVRGLRVELGRLTRLATTFGYGPGFLHSTGQLHKGGPSCGLFIQLVDAATPEVAIPGSESGFGALIQAQAAGDAEALCRSRQWILRVVVGDPPEAAVNRLAAWFAGELRGSTA